MKFVAFMLFALLIPASSYANVDFTGSNWVYGTSYPETIQAIGIASDDGGDFVVVLNLLNNRQVKLSGAHATLGLSLTSYQGKCIKIIPGKLLASVSFILTCN